MPTYYIDYISGNDSNNGTSISTPWQHCKGDNNASGIANSTTIVPGDIVLFKGGVNYLGSIRISSSGSSGSPIVYKGDGWGAQKAIINGSVPFTKLWTQCVNSGECYNNTGFANIWYANTEFSGQNALNTVIINDEFLGFAQDVVPSLPIYFDIVSAWRSTPSFNVDISSLSDSSYFTQSTTNFWTGAYVAIHRGANDVVIRSITGFDTGTNKIIFNALPSTMFYNPTPYSILGHPYNLTENTYAVIGDRMWIWPSGNINPNSLNISIAKLPGGLDVTDRHNVTFDGLKIAGYFGESYTLGYGIYHNPGSAAHYDGLKILNCEFKNMRSINQDAILFLRNLDNCLITGNILSQSLRSKGMYCVGNNFNVSDNLLQLLGGTSVYFAGVTTGSIQRNNILGIRGAHGNGLSVYQNSSGISVEKNYLSGNSFPITYEQMSGNILFDNNMVDCSYGVVNEWGNMLSGSIVRWYNNTFVNSPSHNSLNIDRSNGVATYYVSNNILDGMTWNNNTIDTNNVIHTNNLWIGYYAGFAIPTMGTGESINSGLSTIFANTGISDYSLKAGSPAIGSGINLSAYFNTDINGIIRSIPWDIGAYAYAGFSGISYTFKRLGRYLKLRGLAIQ